MAAAGSSSGSLVDLWTRGGYPCGLFIAESGVVAARTNITTVTQFRPVDHALGGSGAPLMQYLDFVAFRGRGKPTVTLNIGGIANLQLADADRSKMMYVSSGTQIQVFFFFFFFSYSTPPPLPFIKLTSSLTPPTSPPRAFDTGPGNVMIDHVMRVRLGKEYDQDGQTAAKGTVVSPLLDELMAREFFQRKPPRSAWRLDFGSSYADDILRRYSASSTEDLVATFTAFTSRSVERALVDFVLPRVPELDELIASGGGTRNLFLMRLLGERLDHHHGVKLCTSDVYGIPAAYKEAIKFATLAFATKRGLANNIPAASGASRFAVLGKLTWAPGLAKAV